MKSGNKLYLQFKICCYVSVENVKHVIRLEGEFGSLPHLRVGLLQTTVKPRSELAIPVTFLPRACQPYSNSLLFLVDGTHRHNVTFKGMGVDLNVSI